MAIIVSAEHNTRIAPIGPDGLTRDGAVKVRTVDILDIQPNTETSQDADEPIPAIVGDRGTITIPSEVRRRLQLRSGSPILIEVSGESLVIKPAEITPRRTEPSPTLEAILAGVTAENRHTEFETGDAVGREAL